MVLRKITVDNSVRYIPKGEQTKEIRQNKIKNKKKVNKVNLFQEVKQTQENKTEKISQNIKKINKNVVASGFGVLTKQYVHV